MVSADQVAVVQVHPDGVVTFVRTDLDYELDGIRHGAHRWVDAETYSEFGPEFTAVLEQVWQDHLSAMFLDDGATFSREV